MIQINGMEFSPRPDCRYKFDYVKIAEAAKRGVWLDGTKCDELSVYRQFVLNDLWFLLYFGMGYKVANHPFWVNACKELENGPQDFTLDLWAREHGKAVDVDEPVPVPGGWTNHGELKAGDTVYGPDGEPCRVVGRTRVFDDSDCYRVAFSDGYSVVVSGDHLWTVERRTRRRIPMTYKTEGVPQRVYREPSVICTRDIAGMEHSPDNRLAVRATDPVEFPEHMLPIPPYTLGAWLGDGSSSNGSITCAYADREIIENIRYMDGITAKERKSTNSNSGLWQLGDGVKNKKGTGLTWRLRILGVLNNKHIPKMYLRNTVANRVSLLKGLMDTDGTCDTRGTAMFSNINEELAHNVFELAASLGLCPRIRKVNTQVNGSPYVSYQVSFQAYKSFQVFGLRRKLARCKDGKRVARRFIVSVEPAASRPVSCIQVDRVDGLYLIGKNFVTTHNSSIITKGETIQFVLKNPEKSCGIFSYVKPLAKKFLFEIKETFHTSVFLRSCFPDVIWNNCEKESPLWTQDEGIILRRKTNMAEPNVSAWGLTEGMPTGMHFDRRVYDDISTEDLARSLDMMEQVKTKFDSSQNIGKEGGHHRVVGTYYHHSDPLIYIRNKKTPEGKPKYHYRFKPATHDGTGSGRPVFLSQNRLDDLKLTRTFNFQQLLDPTPGADQRLNPKFLSVIEPQFIPRDLFRVMLIDQAGDAATNKVAEGGDSWAVAVVGVEPVEDKSGQPRVFIEDLWIQPAGASEAIDRIVQMYLFGGMIERLCVEKVGISTTHLHIAQALKGRGRHINFEDRGNGILLRPAGRNKKQFIESALAWPLNNGKIFYSSSVPTPYMERLKMEMENFPLWHDDGLNVLAYLYDVIKDVQYSFRSAGEVDEDAGNVVPIRSQGASEIGGY